MQRERSLVDFFYSYLEKEVNVRLSIHDENQQMQQIIQKYLLEIV